MAKSDVFSRERDEIANAKALLAKARATKTELVDGLEAVTSGYERSLRRAERVTKISDRSQRRIVQKGERLRTIRKVKVANGVYWIEIPEVDLRVLCGCPADAVKLLIKRGLIVSTERDPAFRLYDSERSDREFGRVSGASNAISPGNAHSRSSEQHRREADTHRRRRRTSRPKPVHLSR